MTKVYYCNCGVCGQCKNESWREERNLHPFYRGARKLWHEVQLEQIKKGDEKYDKTLGESDWTPEEIVHHAVMENVDQMHYLTLLLERVREMKTEVEALKNDSVGRDVYEMVCRENDRLAKENMELRPVEMAQQVVLKAEYDQVFKERDKLRVERDQAIEDAGMGEVAITEQRKEIERLRDRLNKIGEALKL